MKAKVFKILFLLFASYIAVISLQPTNNVLMSIPYMDKVLHMAAYALFTTLGYFATTTPRKFRYVCLAMILFSIGIEYGQSFVPGRMMSGFDLMANIVGIIIAATLVKKLFPKQWVTRSAQHRL
jgi:VanZ family protein